MSDYRKPPEQTPAFILECRARQKELGGGYCKVCGIMIPKGDGTPHKGRAICSRKCKIRYDEAWSIPSGWITKQHLRELLGEKCKVCGDPGEEIDHIKALSLLTDAERLEIKWWELGNLQLLCTYHHRLKTNQDMAKLRAMKRNQGQDGLFNRGLRLQ